MRFETGVVVKLGELVKGEKLKVKRSKTQEARWGSWK
jgi:hypothetical protein